MNNWKRIEPKSKYWHPGNTGFNSTNTKFICYDCHYEVPFNFICQDCGSSEFVLGTGMGLPGIFCKNCEIGSLTWKCPSCNNNRRLFLSLYYDADILKIKKRKWFS